MPTKISSPYLPTIYNALFVIRNIPKSADAECCLDHRE